MALGDGSPADAVAEAVFLSISVPARTPFPVGAGWLLASAQRVRPVTSHAWAGAADRGILPVGVCVGRRGVAVSAGAGMTVSSSAGMAVSAGAGVAVSSGAGAPVSSGAARHGFPWELVVSPGADRQCPREPAVSSGAGLSI